MITRIFPVRERFHSGPERPEGIEIRLCTVKDAPALSAFYQTNAEHLRAWEPVREHTLKVWKKRLLARTAEQKTGAAAYFLAIDPVTGEVMATCSLFHVTLGAFRACFMGYSVAKCHEGRGVMKKTCLHAIDYAFNTMGLNRIMANYMPVNQRSENLLQSLGFVKEGFAERYLCINGQWEDHVLTALVNHYPPPAAYYPAGK